MTATAQVPTQHGRRRRLNPASAWSLSHLHDGLQVLAEGTGTNNRTTYTLAPSAIGGIICRDANGTKYWYHFDRLGNVVGVTDANGDVHTLYTMEAFGDVVEMTSGGDFSQHRATPRQPYHLTTKEYDSDANLYYFNARWYDRYTGRFVSRDLTASSLQAYQFCTNNPARFVDVTGATPQNPHPPDRPWVPECPRRPGTNPPGWPGWYPDHPLKDGPSWWHGLPCWCETLRSHDLYKQIYDDCMGHMAKGSPSVLCGLIGAGGTIVGGGVVACENLVKNAAMKKCLMVTGWGSLYVSVGEAAYYAGYWTMAHILCHRSAKQCVEKVKSDYGLPYWW